MFRMYIFFWSLKYNAELKFNPNFTVHWKKKENVIASGTFVYYRHTLALWVQRKRIHILTNSEQGFLHTLIYKMNLFKNKNELLIFYNVFIYCKYLRTVRKYQTLSRAVKSIRPLISLEEQAFSYWNTCECIQMS